MTRLSFLRGLFVTLAGSLLAAPLARRLDLPGLARMRWRADTLARRRAWHGVLPSPRSARVIGMSYLERTPDERTADVVIHRLNAALGTPAAALSGDALRARVRERIRRDFETEDIVQLDGWILSRTECRICALAALL